MAVSCVCSQVRACRIKSDEVALERIDEVMKEILGETATRIIYDCAEQHSSLKREDIPERLDVFLKYLEIILGSGAVVVENAVIRNLRSNP